MSSVKPKSTFQKRHRFLLGVGILVVISVLYFVTPKFFTAESTTDKDDNPAISEMAEKTVPPKQEVPKVLHIKTPKAVKAVYMTSCVAGTPSLRKNIVKLIEETELNSIIIDIKDWSGTISFKPSDTGLLPAWENSKCGATDMKEFIEELHDNNIYVIGRITVFQDPHLAKLRPDLAVKKASDGSTWKDKKGLSFTDPGAKEVWDYHIKLAEEAYNIGFDELNFDYIRFPSDGPMNDIYFTWSNGRAKAEVLEEFFSYLSSALKKDEDIKISADLFGMTTTNTDDLNIGQVLERTLPYFDYVAPMVYPSHYPPTWNGFPNPNHYPYEVVNISMKEAVRRTIAERTPVKTLNGKPIYDETLEFDEISGATTTKRVFSGFYTKESYDSQKMRPWIQDFDYGGDYGPVEVRAQIQATYDAGLTSWMLWSPSNVYTREALDDGDTGWVVKSI